MISWFAVFFLVLKLRGPSQKKHPVVFRPISYLEKEVDVGQVGEGWESDGCDEVLHHVLLVSEGMADRGGWIWVFEIIVCLELTKFSNSRSLCFMFNGMFLFATQSGASRGGAYRYSHTHPIHPLRFISYATSWSNLEPIQVKSPSNWFLSKQCLSLT